ncbi:MAG: EAL domain-containing protein [Gammaproteobacteria bacterium]
MAASEQSLAAQLRRRQQEIHLLSEITQMICSEHHLQRVFDLVASSALQLLQVETVSIPILSEDRRSYTYRAACGVNAGELLGAELPIEVGLCGWVLRHRRAWWRGAPEMLDANERNQWEKEAGSVILVPLIGKQRFLGGIACINRLDGREFGAEDMELLSLFAGQVSIAIENAMSFEELQAARLAAEAYREKLERLNQRLIAANRELKHLAVHDPLTGLPNRTLIMDRLQQSMITARQGAQDVALIMIDLDHFKEVNDSLGHATGDQLLIRIGGLFRGVLREEDTIGRLGGDEFAVVIPAAGKHEALAVAGKLGATLKTPVLVGKTVCSVGASMGIAICPEHGEHPSVLLKCADVAMYIAKRNRNDIAVYDEALDTNHPERLDLISDLRVAIQQRIISAAFQPKLDIQSGMIVGAEALARWERPQHGPVSPVEFVPILEQTGLIKPFTLQIVEHAVRFCRQCVQAGYELSVAVNLSVHNLRDPRLPELVGEILSRHGLDARLLTLEITESAVMTDPEQCQAILTRLHGMGVSLSIDDFGTGYSSLSYLKRMPVQKLKIDRSFVRDMVRDSDDAIIVRSTIDLAHNLGLKTIAEGVETEETLAVLQAMHCDMVQGYLISRPLAAQEFLDFLKAGDWRVQCAATA